MHRILALTTHEGTSTRLADLVEAWAVALTVVDRHERALDALQAADYQILVFDTDACAVDAQARRELLEAAGQQVTVFDVAEQGFDAFVELLDDAPGIEPRAPIGERPDSGKYFVSDTQGRPFLERTGEAGHVRQDGLERDTSHIEGAQRSERLLLYVGPSDAFRRALEDGSRDSAVEVVVCDSPRELRLSEGAPPLDLVVLSVGEDLGDPRRAIRYLRRHQPENTFEVVILCQTERRLGDGLARSFGADDVLVRPVEPQELLERAQKVRPDAERVDMLVYAPNSSRVPTFQAALAREPVDVVFAVDVEEAADAFETRTAQIVLVDRADTADACRALIERLKSKDPFAPTRFIGVVDGDQAETTAPRELFDDVLDMTLGWSEIRRVVRRQIAHINYGRMRLETDALTGVRSALLLAEHLQARLDRAQDGDESVMLTGLDVDGLEDINNRYGPAVGDSVLRSLADSLRLAVEAGDAIYRTDSDEFFVLQSAEAVRAHESRERIDRALRVFQQQTFRAPDGRGTYATATGGTVVVPPVRVSAELCLEKCWVVLERAMRTRRDQLLVAHLDPSMLAQPAPVRKSTDGHD